MLLRLGRSEGAGAADTVENEQCGVNNKIPAKFASVQDFKLANEHNVAVTGAIGCEDEFFLVNNSPQNRHAEGSPTGFSHSYYV